jgi:hypothetical protein
MNTYLHTWFLTHRLYDECYLYRNSEALENKGVLQSLMLDLHQQQVDRVLLLHRKRLHYYAFINLLPRWPYPLPSSYQVKHPNCRVASMSCQVRAESMMRSAESLPSQGRVAAELIHSTATSQNLVPSHCRVVLLYCQVTATSMHGSAEFIESVSRNKYISNNQYIFEVQTTHNECRYFICISAYNMYEQFSFHLN